MKKIFMILALGAMVVACTPDNGGNNDDGKNRITLDFEGEKWDALIDDPQYGGTLLYGATPYSWYDEKSDIAHNASNSEWDGDFYPNAWIGVSNYCSTDYTANSNSMAQLTVHVEAMHSGTNCVVCNGYKSSWGDNRPTLSFRNEASYIESVWVANTTYLYAEVVGCEGSYAAPLTAEQSIWVRATGYTLDAEGNEVEGSSLDFYLYKDGKDALNGGWKKWNLSSLGKVNKVKFDVQWNGAGGADNFRHPAYFAIDDITVVKE